MKKAIYHRRIAPGTDRFGLLKALREGRKLQKSKALVEAMFAREGAFADEPRRFEARFCKGMPADCCDYGVVSFETGKEVCRVWNEDDALLIADLLENHHAGLAGRNQGEP